MIVVHRGRDRCFVSPQGGESIRLLGMTCSEGVLLLCCYESPFFLLGYMLSEAYFLT